MVDVTRRGFLSGLLGTAVIVALPPHITKALTPDPVDPFSITAPPGWVYQWARTAVMGMPHTGHLQRRLENGWTFVDPKLYPGAPVSTVEKAIEASGLILIQRNEAEVHAQRRKEAEALLAGTGKIVVDTPTSFEIRRKPTPEYTTVACSKCEGSGQVHAETCDVCLGFGTEIVLVGEGGKKARRN